MVISARNNLPVCPFLFMYDMRQICIPECLGLFDGSTAQLTNGACKKKWADVITRFCFNDVCIYDACIDAWTMAYYYTTILLWCTQGLIWCTTILLCTILLYYYYYYTYSYPCLNQGNPTDLSMTSHCIYKGLKDHCHGNWEHWLL